MKRDALRKRADYMAAVRAYFVERDIIEVDTPAISTASSIDTHIDVMEVELGEGQQGYLHTSPEYGMKKLLAEGSGDIYQMSHVFRKGELSPLHSPEFTMIEWYRCGIDLDAFIEETIDLIRIFLPDQTATILTYQTAFHQHTGLDPFNTNLDDLLDLADKHQLNFSAAMKQSDYDTLLQIIFSSLVEPKLQTLTVVQDFPKAQAALAQTNGPVAKRFEIYYQGIELANGFHELTDAEEQERRLQEENHKRQALGKPALPIDNSFLEALRSGLPDCCGVACGFDRLLRLAEPAAYSPLSGNQQNQL